jgi:Cu(I)/Ag(I) efflux system membrane protein CusA/SilA
MQRARAQLAYVVPVTLAIIVALLYTSFRSVTAVGILIGSLPLAVAGGIWLLYLLNFNYSVAVGVGFIALAGVAVETGVIMLLYLEQAHTALQVACAEEGKALTVPALRAAVQEGASRRLRPVTMTATATIIGLLPIMAGTGTGSDVMQRIAAPMVGGMISALVLTLWVIPALYFLWKRRALKHE